MTQGTARPVLYSFRRCPYAMRARLALAASGMSYELREIVLRDKPAELIAASPKATVPVLVLPGSQVLDESLDIMRWALAQHDPEGWLQPPTGTLDDMAALIAGNDGHFKQQLDRYKYPNRFAPLKDAASQRIFAHHHRSAAAEWLAQLEPRLHHGWLCGDRASLADMALLPFVRQFAHTDAAWFAAQPWPRLCAWLAAFEASPRFERIMDKHVPWPVQTDPVAI